tara:strand:- start:59 stop:262 length:204 start_codon:yes stop_codon:yes gene_type:complete
MFTKKLINNYIQLPQEINNIIYKKYIDMFTKYNKNLYKCVSCGINNLNYYDYLDGVGPICGPCQYGI